jgi:hypothetical protein
LGLLNSLGTRFEDDRGDRWNESEDETVRDRIIALKVLIVEKFDKPTNLRL